MQFKKTVYLIRKCLIINIKGSCTTFSIQNFLDIWTVLKLMIFPGNPKDAFKAIFIYLSPFNGLHYFSIPGSSLE